MTKQFKLLGILFLSTIILFNTSCKDDDPIIDPGTGDINVADGMYMALSGADPLSSTGLSAETVEDDSFTSQDRDGFIGGYMYLEAGDYNLVTVVDKESTGSLGGTATAATDEGSACGYNDYTVVAIAEGGDAFNVATSGLYRVTYDQTLSEMILYQIVNPGLIGSATPGGWAADTELQGSVTADGGSWTMSDVVLRNGQWKVRFNCRWNLDRRLDPNAGFLATNGYQLFTNFGGSADNLAPGNDMPNIEQTEEGTYTITIDWSPQNDFSVDVDRTGDAPVLAFDPGDFNWGVIGDATANAWDADRNLIYKDNGGVPTWYGVVQFADAGEWKVRINDDWNLDLGGAITTDGVATTMDAGGANIPSPGAGQYYITISTADEGDSWQMTLKDMGWGLIGEGSPSGSWDVDTPLVPQGFDGGVSTWTYTGDFTTAPWKFRAGADWPLNLGENLATLILDGGDIVLGAAGTYEITFTFDGADYSATAVLQ